MNQAPQQASEGHQQQEGRRKRCACHLNSLGSLGYSVVTLGLTTYVLASEVQQFLKYMSMPWPHHSLPHLELNVHIGLVGAAAVLLVFFFLAAVFKIGNYANDGYRLGVQDSVCSRDPPPLPGPAGGLVRGAWLHGGPTAPFLHILVAQLLIIARLVIEAAATKATIFPESKVWWSEVSRVLPHRDRLSVFSFLAHYPPTTTPTTPTQEGPVALSYESSTSVTFHALDLDFGDGGGGGGTGADAGGGGGDWQEDEDVWHIGEIPWGPFSPHFLNLVLAHLVYAGRYAGVFWGTNKALGLVLLTQLLINGATCIFSLAGFQVLYKVQAVGPDRMLAVFKGFLLPLPATVAVFCASQVLVLASGSVVYLYGFVKFGAFLSAEKEKYHILSKHGHQSPWSYWPHCWGLMVLVAMVGLAWPLVNDWTVVYRASLDTSVLAATLATLLHLLLWVILWLVLTLKSVWHFKLRVQVSKTIVTNTHSIRLVNEVQLSRQIEESEGPVMVIGAGKTYLLHDGSPKRSLMKLIRHTVTQKKARGEEEEIYWLRPKAPPAGSSWGRRSQQSPGVKHKVTFHDTPSSSRKRHSGRGGEGDLSERSDAETSDSDGDYARLRDVSFPGPASRISHKEEAGQDGNTQSAECVSVGGDFPAPPPELTDPAHYPPPPATPPPPLPDPPESCGPAVASPTLIQHQQPQPPPQQLIHQQQPQQLQQQQQQHQPQLIQQHQQPPQLIQHQQPQHQPQYQQHQQPQQQPQHHQQPHPQIHVLRGNSVEGSPGRTGGGGEAKAGVEAPRCSDSSSTTSSVTPPDKRCDSGIHSQASYTSSSASHSKSGSSGSESCVPPPGGVPPGGVAQPNMAAVPGVGGGGVARCSSVDDLCLAPPPPPPPQPCVKSLSLQRGTDPPSATTQQPAGQGAGGGQGGDQSGAGRGTRLNIEVVGGGYRFLPPAKFVASEPVYSDASTPVVIKRRSSVTVEPDTPPYERSGSSFTTFTEPQLPRAVLRQGGCQAKALTVAAHGARARRLAAADSKHATIAGATPPKGFHQPAHVDTRYFSVPAVKPPGTGVMA